MIVSLVTTQVATSSEERNDTITTNMGNFLTCNHHATLIPPSDVFDDQDRRHGDGGGGDDDDAAAKDFPDGNHTIIIKAISSSSNISDTIRVEGLDGQDPELLVPSAAAAWLSFLSTRRRALSGIITGAAEMGDVTPPQLASSRTDGGDDDDSRHEDLQREIAAFPAAGRAPPPSAMSTTSSSVNGRARPPPLPLANGRMTTTNMKKSVVFGSVTVRATLHRNDYTYKERVASWITVEEFLTMRQSCQRIARQMNDSTSIKPGLLVWQQHPKTRSSDATRGLERLSKHRSRVHAERKQVLMDEIFFLREGRSRLRRYNPDEVAALFRSHTAPSAKEARAMGREDEKRAQACYNISPSSSSSSRPPHRRAALSEGGNSRGRTVKRTSTSMVDENRNDVDTESCGRRETSADAN